MTSIRCLIPILRLKLKSWLIVREAMQSSEPDDDSCFLRLGWKLAPGIVELPDWFEENRVQGHTRLVINHVDWGFGTPAFQNAAAKFKELGAGAYTRHVKFCFHDPWWPTKVPADPNGIPLWDGVIDPCNEMAPNLAQITIPDGQNVVQEMVDEAHGEGLHLITYYWHMSDQLISDDHPQWICKNPDCVTDITHRRGPWLDISELEYREFVLKRLLELADLGVDSLYFDFRHLPMEGCWCSALAAAFEVELGVPPPTTTDMADQLYRQFLDFKAYKIEEAFEYWKQGVKSQFPHVVFVISATGIPVPHNRIETTNLVRLADSTKNEFKHALNLPIVINFFDKNMLAEPDKDIRQAFGWVLMRDSTDGRPPHIWEHAFPNHEHALSAAAALVTYGTVANMNVDEKILAGFDPRPSFTPVEGLKAAFDLGNKVSPYLGHSRPLRWAAVHFSELARNRRGEKLVNAWKEVLWPAMGAYGVFVRERLPVGIVNDYQLEHNLLEGYQVLFLPNPSELTNGQKNTIRQFVARGGILLKNNPGWPWSDPSMSGVAEQAFRTELQRVVECFTSPVQVLSGSEQMHAVAFEDGRRKRLLVAVTNDYCFVQWVESGEPINSADINLPPLPINDAEVLVSNRVPPLQIFEVISGTQLIAQSSPQGYKVRLPSFQAMALLVVQE